MFSQNVGGYGTDFIIKMRPPFRTKMQKYASISAAAAQNCLLHTARPKMRPACAPAQPGDAAVADCPMNSQTAPQSAEYYMVWAFRDVNRDSAA